MLTTVELEGFIPFKLFASRHIIPMDTMTVILIVIKKHDKGVGINLSGEHEATWREILDAECRQYTPAADAGDILFTPIGDRAPGH